jgi:hypothetical protein
VTMEVRYIAFTPEETRNAIVAFVQRRGPAATPDDIAAVEVVGEHEVPTAIVRLRPPLSTTPINLSSQDVIGALLLYCSDRRIPVPKRADKKVELSINGLTLVVTTDPVQRSPVVADNGVSYNDIASHARQEIALERQKLTRAIARAEYAEAMTAQADTKARQAEDARARSSAMLAAITISPGVRGRLGRWLINYRPPASDDGI